MKKFSIKKFLQEMTGTLKRFPAAMLCAFIGSFAIILLNYLTDHSYLYEEYDHLIKIAMAASLGIPIFTGLKFIQERKGLSYKFELTGILSASAFLILYYFSIDLHEADYIQYAILVSGSILFVSVAPYIKEKHRFGFWQYNRILLLQLLISVFFTFVLFAGLAVAILGSEKLLHFDWDHDIYFNLWIFLAGVFNTWMFLANTPKNFDVVDKTKEYHKLIKLFAQFVLLPIGGLYFIILYFYTAEILIKWQLPNGWVSGLVLGYAGVSLLARVLLFPVKEQNKSSKFNMISKIFTISLFPLLVLASVAAFRRISDYGLTEARYLLIVLIAWLVIMSVYFLVVKRESLKMIPLSLLLLSIITAFGPWSAISISADSQLSRLTDLLAERDSLTTQEPVSESLLNTNRENLRSVLRYLTKRKMNEEMYSSNELFKKNFTEAEFDSLEYYDILDNLKIDEMRLSDKYITTENNQLIYFGTDIIYTEEIKIYGSHPNKKYKGKDNNEIIMAYDENSFILDLNFALNSQTSINDNLKINIADVFIDMIKNDTKYRGDAPKIIEKYETDNLEIQITFNSIGGSLRSDRKTTKEIDNFTFSVIARIKNR